MLGKIYLLPLANYEVIIEALLNLKSNNHAKS